MFLKPRYGRQKKLDHPFKHDMKKFILCVFSLYFVIYLNYVDESSLSKILCFSNDKANKIQYLNHSILNNEYQICIDYAEKARKTMKAQKTNN